MNSSRVLVAGGAGFIGSNLVHLLVEEGYEVKVVDKLTYAGFRENLKPVMDEIDFIEGDICDRNLISELYGEVDVAINLAAESHVDRSIESGEPFVESNVKGAFVMMDEMRKASLEKLVHMSTDEVYGSIESGSFEEEDRLDPSSPYSASKASADMFFNAFRKTYDLPITLTRCTNIYGPRQHPEKLIPKLMMNAMEEMKLPIYGDGSNRRQWLFVEDVCKALLKVLKEGSHSIYNIGSGVEEENIGIARTVLDITGKSEDLIEFVEDRKGHDFRYSLDDSKLKSEAGWEPETGLREGLERTHEWYRENLSRYR